MLDTLHNFTHAFTDTSGHQIGLAILFAGVLLCFGGVVADLRRPIADDQSEPAWLADVPPWPLAGSRNEGESAGTGGGNTAALNTLSFHGRHK